MEIPPMIVKKKANPAFKRFQTLPLLASLSTRALGAKNLATAKTVTAISLGGPAATDLTAGSDSGAGQIQLMN